MTATADVCILVVDDEFMIAETVSRRLKMEGYQMAQASSAQEALKRLSEQDFALMITDIRMPEMDGIELLKRTRETYPDMATIMLTGLSDTQTAIESMRQGAFDYLVKPFNFDALVLSVCRAFEHRTLLLQNRDYQQSLERKVEERTRLLKRQHQHLKKLHSELEGSFFDTIRVFTGLIELYEPFLGAHVKRVAALSVTLARFLELPEEQMRTIEMSALLHDIGLVGISTHLMLKRRFELSTPEFELIKRSPEYGQKVLESIPRLQEVGTIIRAQHEHFDGSGFPDGLKGKQIPYEARLLAVTNAYDAIRFKRDADQSLTTQAAIYHLRKMAGKQFDPAMVDGFIQVFSGQKVRHKSSESSTPSSVTAIDDYRTIQYREFGELKGDDDGNIAAQPVRVQRLKPGMRIARPVCTNAGTILVGVGTVLTEPLVAKLKQSHEQQTFHDPVYISA